MLSFFIIFANSIETSNHVKPFRPGTSVRSILDVKHFSIFVQISVINAKFLIICHLLRRHILRKYKTLSISYLFLRKKSTRDQLGTKTVIQNLSIKYFLLLPGEETVFSSAGQGVMMAISVPPKTKYRLKL